MATSNLSHGWYGNLISLMPVYNPITLVVDSDKKTRTNFAYIADIYNGGTVISGQQFLTRLESFPNLSNYYGVFDVHRPLQSVVSYDLNWSATSVVQAPNSAERFTVEFGERYSTLNRFSSIQSRASGTYAGYVQINTTAPHSVIANDWVLIEKDNGNLDGSLDDKFLVREVVSTTAFVINKLYSTLSGGTNQTGSYYEGTGFFDTLFYNGNVALLCNTPHYCSKGDAIVINKDTKTINPQYDGQWSVSAVSSSTVIITTIPWGSDSVAESGMFYVKGSRTYTGQSSSPNYAWVMNSVADYDDEVSFGRSVDYYSKYSFRGSGQNSKFLTNAPYHSLVQTSPKTNKQKIMSGDNQTLSFFANTDLLSDFSWIVMALNWKSGGTNHYLYKAGPYQGNSSPSITRLDVGVGPANINSGITAGNVTIMTGGVPGTTNTNTAVTQQIKWTTVDNYYVYGYYSGAPAYEGYNVSNAYAFELDEDCSKYDTYRFMWLNRLSGMDYFNFRKRSDKIFKIEKQEYQKKLGRFNGSVYGFTKGDRVGTVYNVDIEERVKVYSDWITEAESEWLMELFTSPEVYIIRDNKLFPIVILNNEYVVGKRENQKLFNYNVEFRYAFEKISQRG